MAINNLSQKNMELNGIKLIILGALLLIGLALSIWSIVASTKCSNSCTAVTPVVSSPGTSDPVSSPNLGAGDSVGPTGPTGPQGPTLNTAFVLASGIFTFAQGASAPVVSSSSYNIKSIAGKDGAYNILFNNPLPTTQYILLGNALAPNASPQNYIGTVMVGVSPTKTTTMATIYVSTSSGIYNGTTYVNFAVLG